MKKKITLTIALALAFLGAPALLQAQSCTTDVTSLCVAYKSGVNVVVRFNIAGDYNYQWKKYNPDTQAWENHGDVSVTTGIGAYGWFENNSYVPKIEKYRIEAEEAPGEWRSSQEIIVRYYPVECGEYECPQGATASIEDADDARVNVAFSCWVEINVTCE